jgi:hypothetical protein
MRDVIDFLVQLILAITGAVGMALALAGGWAIAGGCALWGGHWCWKRWTARTAKSRKDDVAD